MYILHSQHILIQTNPKMGGTWVAQSVKPLTLTHTFVNLSPTSGSLLSAQSPLRILCLPLSYKTEQNKKQRQKQTMSNARDPHVTGAIDCLPKMLSGLISLICDFLLTCLYSNVVLRWTQRPQLISKLRRTLP